MKKQFNITPQESTNLLIKNTIKYPICEIKDYIRLKNKINMSLYKNMSSNEQIKTIMKLSKKYKLKSYSDRLFILISRHISMNKLYKLLNSNTNDNKIYKILSKYVRHKREKTLEIYLNPDLPCDGYVRLAQKITYKINKHIIERDPNFKMKNYLDIGCGNCIKTKLIGDLLELKSNNIYGADIPKWSGYNQEQRKKLPINIIDIKPNKKLPIKSNKFSLVSTLMVLHHVNNLKLMLTEINRILELNGYLIIKEHDCLTSIDYMLADVEHALYGIVINNNDKFINDYYSEYYDWLEWDVIIHKFGFKKIHYELIYTPIDQYFQPTRGFISIYKKIKNI